MVKSTLDRSRRAFFTWASVVFPASHALADSPPVPLADMHSHLFFNMRDRTPIRERLLLNRVALMAYHVVPDGALLGRDPTNGRVSVKRAQQPGEVYTFFQRMITVARKRLTFEGVDWVATRSDAFAASAQAPRILLAVEGADFIERDFSRLEEAFKLGVRQIGIAHFIDSEFVDNRTTPPRFGGLTTDGQRFIEQCNALGILVDVSHSTDEAIEQACRVSTKPMIYSHGSIGRWRSNYRSGGADVMSVSRSTARALANGGGLVGIWGHTNTFRSIDQYAGSIAKFVDWVGEDHLALGTDIGGLGTPADPAAFDLLKRDYGELRKVLDLLERSGLSAAQIEKIAIGNYRRVLGEVLPVANS
jgi:membrane dipeptidase